MSACSRVTCGTCFYCDGMITRHEHDHAPSPRRCGGVETVVACMTCHAMKDRHAIDRWPLALLVLAAAEIGNLGLVFDGTQDEWPDCWDDMSGHARVLWAKGAAISMDRRMVESTEKLPLDAQ